MCYLFKIRLLEKDFFKLTKVQPSSKYFSSHNILPNLSESQTVWNPSPVLFILKVSWSNQKIYIEFFIWFDRMNKL